MAHERYNVLDTIRGIDLLNMIIYHAIWNLVYLYDVNWKWYRSDIAYIWQQGICWVFIILSGFCWSLGRNQIRRGICIFGGGMLISFITLLFMPQNRVVFGVLTLLGTCMLLMVPLHKVLQRFSPFAGMMGCMFLFLITKNINSGILGSEALLIGRMPGFLYRNLFTAYLGFPSGTFYSTDYFSVFPWFFLFAAGYFTYRLFLQKNWLRHFRQSRISVMEWIGRHSFGIYIIHQPILYFSFAVVMGWC